MSDTVNICIKSVRGNYATTKFQLMDPDEKSDNVHGLLDEDGKKRKTVTVRERGYRALEVDEVVQVPADLPSLAIGFKSGVIEKTDAEPTRPLFFDEIDPNRSTHLARTTSKTFNASDTDKVEEQALANEEVAQHMESANTAGENARTAE